MAFWNKSLSTAAYQGSANKELTSSSMGIPSYEFIQANLLRELASLSEDILQPYVFSDPWMDHIFDYATRKIYQTSLTAKQILMKAMLGKELTINRIDLDQDCAHVTLFLEGNPDDQGCIPVGDLGLLRPTRSLVFTPIYSQEEMDLLRKCFSSLWFAYERQERHNMLDTKAIFKMHGFHAVFTNPKNAEEEAIAIANRERIIANVQSILDGNAGIMDAQDEFGLMGGNCDMARANRATVDQIYMEIARILKIPATRLLGRSPEGMNSTGVSDALNYDMTLDGIRSGWMEPFFDQMQIAYHKVDKIDIAYLKDILQMHVMLGIQPDPHVIEKVRILAKKL